jgi:hypothetical protein
MCLNKECVYVTIGIDDFGDRYITHYRYNQKKTDLIVLFREYIESRKTKKKPTIQHQNYLHLH